MDKKSARLRRAKRARSKMQELGVNRLCVHRTLQHIYAQVISPDRKVLVCASTLEKDIKGNLKCTSNALAAAEIGKTIGVRALDKGITKVAFDRAGNKYHGRIRALADAAREAGLEF